MALSTNNFSWGAVVVMAACLTRPAFALDPRYPDWPCRQLKVPGISIASAWTGPSIEAIDKTKPTDPKEADLVSHLAARRTPMEDARKLIAGFVVGTDQEKQEKAKTLFLRRTRDSPRRRARPATEFRLASHLRRAMKQAGGIASSTCAPRCA